MRDRWALVRLGEILKPVSRPEPVNPAATYSLLGAHWYATGLYTKEILSGSQIRAGKVYRVKKGDFVYNRLFAWKGSFAIASKENHGCFVSNEFPCFRIDPERADGRFLWRYFSRSSTWDEALGLSAGGTPTSRNRLKEEKLLAMTIPLPPLAEQRRVVARVEELAAQIHEARTLRYQASDEAASLVPATARERLDEVKTEKTELRRWLDKSREGIQTGPFGAQLSKSEFTEQGVPLLTIGNVQYGGLDFSDLLYVSEDKAKQLQRYAVREGDILFARMGTVGRCCVVPKKVEGWLINYHIIRVALDTAHVEPRYIHWTIRASADVENFLQEMTRGATRAGVNSKIVGSLPCRVPPLAEQRRVVAELDALQAEVDALKRLQAQTAAELDALLPSVLDKAFKGEL
jgi:type I restriction enzyme S subunit